MSQSSECSAFSHSLHRVNVEPNSQYSTGQSHTRGLQVIHWAISNVETDCYGIPPQYKTSTGGLGSAAGALEDSASSGPGAAASAAAAAARCFLPIVSEEVRDGSGRKAGAIRLDSGDVDFVLICAHKSHPSMQFLRQRKYDHLSSLLKHQHKDSKPG